MKTFNSDLVLEKDTVFDESITVRGNISCKNGMRYSLKVRGNIIAHDIKARNIIAHNIIAYDIDADNIDALNIDAHNIDSLDIKALDINALGIDTHNIDALDIKAHDINARNIDAHDINSYYIICETRRKKTKKSTTFCKVFVQNRSKLERKYHEVEK